MQILSYFFEQGEAGFSDSLIDLTNDQYLSLLTQALDDDLQCYVIGLGRTISSNQHVESMFPVRHEVYEVFVDLLTHVHRLHPHNLNLEVGVLIITGYCLLQNLQLGLGSFVLGKDFEIGRESIQSSHLISQFDGHPVLAFLDLGDQLSISVGRTPEDNTPTTHGHIVVHIGHSDLGPHPDHIQRVEEDLLTHLGLSVPEEPSDPLLP
jgi:hypothetical protein